MKRNFGEVEQSDTGEQSGSDTEDIPDTAGSMGGSGGGAR